MKKQLSLDLFHTENANGKRNYDIIDLISTENITDGQIIIYQHFFNELEGDSIFSELLNNINWQQDRIQLFGKEVNLPRLTAWYGDLDKFYTYSGITMNPDPWTETLLSIKKRIEEEININFNSVLANLYRNGQDYVSWHSDDEQELGENPTIASVSFGATRRFLLRHKSNQALETIDLPLGHGSLLIMKGSTQHYWKHQVPKTAKVKAERINLTFRVIK